MPELLRILLDILLPVFLIVGIGFVAGRRLDLDPRTPARLAYWVIGPAFVFTILVGARLGADLVGRMVAATLLAVAVTGALSVAVARLRHRPPEVRAAALTTTIYGNVGNFGLAIVAFTFGEAALPLAGIVMVLVNFVGVATSVAAARWEEHGAAVALRMAFTAPMTLAVVPAVGVNLGAMSLPLWLERSVGLLADALIPLMLLTLGLQLATMRSARPLADTWWVLAAKLVVAPTLAWAATLLVGLEGVAAGVVVLQAAMPSAVFTALIAMEHGLAPALVTTTVLTGTAASMATLPGVIALVRRVAG